MFPSEMVILMAIAAASKPDEKLLSRPLDVVGEYIGYLCSSLVNRGFLKENKPRGYRLTAKGMEALFEFMHKNEGKAGETEKMLQQLGIDVSQEITRLEREAIEAR